MTDLATRRAVTARPMAAVAESAHRVRRAAYDHPVLTVAAIALLARVLVAAGVAVFFHGSLFLDDRTYPQMAHAMATGHTQHWDYYDHWLYRSAATFLVPLTAIYKIFGPVPFAGQLVSVAYGTAAAALTALVAREAVGPRWALVAGGIVALLPSQVLWSSLMLKDAAVWCMLALLAVLVAHYSRARGRRVLVVAAAMVVPLVLLGFLRDQTLVVAAWAVVLASVFGVARDRALRVALAAVAATIVPWAMGLGPAGAHLVAHHGSLVDQRVANALNARTAVVPTAPKPVHSAPAATRPPAAAVPKEQPAPAGSGDETATNLRYLPRGVSVMLLEPLPWRGGGGDGYALARGEAAVWYPLLLLALIGLPTAFRLRRVLAFPVIVGAGVCVMYALAEGNVGTAYRHRGEFVWVVALLATLGVRAIVRRYRPAPDAEPAVIELPATD